METITDLSKILIPSKDYNLQSDERLLIPYIKGGYIGFVTPNGEMVTCAKYAMYYGECHKDTDLIKVAKWYLYGTPEDKTNLKNNLKLLFGIINSKGEEIIPLQYTSLCEPLKSSKLYSVQNRSHNWGAIDVNNKIVIPFGKYAHIWGFDRGFAKVKKVINGKEKFGIIDETGEEVVPVEYDNIWSFYNTNWFAPQMTKDGKKYNFFFKGKRIEPYD